MAKNEMKPINKNKINKIMNTIQSTMNKLYTSTHFATPTNNKDLDNIKTSIDNSIDKIIDAGGDENGSNISTLYRRLSSIGGMHDNTVEISKELQEFLSDETLSSSLIETFSSNRFLKEHDEEIDIICKYMPLLEDALDAKKDNVLTADHFSKDFITAINKSSTDTDEEAASFSSRIDSLKNKYKLIDLFEDIYDTASKYSEAFLYIIPYKTALNKMLDNKNKQIFNESVILSKAELNKLSKDSHNATNTNNISFNSDFKITFNKTGIIESVVDEKINYINSLKIVNESTLSMNENQKFDTVIDQDFEGVKKKTFANDGFIDSSKKSSNTEKVTIPGCIIKKLKRENVVPIYIDDIVIGYYYLEMDNTFNNKVFNNTNTADAPLAMFKNHSIYNKANTSQKDILLKQLSAKISRSLNSKFINANQDLSEEIYSILKYNSMYNENGELNNLKVTFISPENMHHIKFQTDPDTHRGISDLDKALVPAKLFIAIYITNTLGILTRSNDKRVYYVKQNVDTNISKVLLNTLNQLKRSNMGSRELDNIKTMLNVTGRYQDLVIPLSSSGDAPVSFEVMQGQDIDIKQDLLDLLEQNAIDSTGVPYEYVQSRKNVDYAVRLTMSSGKFLRKVFKRQAKCEYFFSRILTVIYNNEYSNNEQIQVKLPPPAFLNILNTNQMLENVDQYVDKIIDIIVTGKDAEDSAYVSIVKSKLKQHYLSTYIDIDTINEIKRQAEMEYKKNLTNENEEV